MSEPDKLQELLARWDAQVATNRALIASAAPAEPVMVLKVIADTLDNAAADVRAALKEEE
jgi:hypothetical protein